MPAFQVVRFELAQGQMVEGVLSPMHGLPCTLEDEMLHIYNVSVRTLNPVGVINAFSFYDALMIFNRRHEMLMFRIEDKPNTSPER